MTRMYVATKAGEETLLEEAALLHAVRNRWPGRTFATTNKTRKARLDGIILQGNDITGAFEVRCRQQTVEKFRSSFNNELMITAEKFHASIDGTSTLLRTTYILFLYLVPSALACFFEIADHDGNIKRKYREAEKLASEACDAKDVKVMRLNAFVDISGVKWFGVKPWRQLEEEGHELPRPMGSGREADSGGEDDPPPLPDTADA
ncbi:hypothetical protein UFOVP119_9 [uncultured Caudovirales phage]|uniref:Uncharacterized protein n=1 Tax=uncultured Caudovirales phage TaxID=2100421 RepID=A0A6J5L8P5_9CAUD|nr:hypothetical protein UFOVP119_9 [uncultured Caudovirales phage]